MNWWEEKNLALFYDDLAAMHLVITYNLSK
jgi:hypothetical protein